MWFHSGIVLIMQFCEITNNLFFIIFPLPLFIRKIKFLFYHLYLPLLVEYGNDTACMPTCTQNKTPLYYLYMYLYTLYTPSLKTLV